LINAAIGQIAPDAFVKQETEPFEFNAESRKYLRVNERRTLKRLHRMGIEGKALREYRDYLMIQRSTRGPEQASDPSEEDADGEDSEEGAEEVTEEDVKEDVRVPPRILPDGPYADRGSLVVDRTREQVTRSVRSLQKDVLIQTLLLGIVFGLPVYAGAQSVLYLVALAYPYIIIMMAIGPILLALKGLGGRVPVAIYESGILVQDLIGIETFIPWGVFTKMEEDPKQLRFRRRIGISDYREPISFPHRETRPGLKLKTGGRQWVIVDKGLHDFDKVADLAKEKIGDMGTVTEEFKEQLSERHLWGNYLAITIAFLVAFALASWAIGKWPIIPDQSSVVSLVLIGTPLAVMAVALATYISHHPFTWFNIRVKPQLMVPTIVVVMLLLVYTGASAFAWYDSWRPDHGVLSTDAPGESSIEIGEYENEVVRATGPVTVGEGEVLTLINTTLLFWPDPWGQYGVWVDEGGILVMLNSTVRSSTLRLGHTFEIHGTALIFDSRIHGTYAGLPGELSDGGVEIFSDDVEIIQTTFVSAQGSAVIISECSPIIESCTFETVMDAGVDVHGGTPRILNSTFTMCQVGVRVNAADAIIRGNKFCETGRGIHVKWSDPVIEDCRFRWISGSAIQYTGTSKPDVKNCLFEEVEVEIDRSVNSMNEICYPVISLVLALVGGVVLLRIKRKWLAAVQESEEAPENGLEESSDGKEEGP
jgi:hypothetical protein